MSFKEFVRVVFGVVLPCVLFVLVYAILISLIPNVVIGGLVFVVTIVPQMFVTLKIIYKLSDRLI